MDNLFQFKDKSEKEYEEYNDMDCREIKTGLEHEADFSVFDSDKYFSKNLKQYKVLTSDENIELFKKLEKAKTNVEKSIIREQISVGNSALAWYYAKKYYFANKKDPKIDFYDVFQEGMAGLLIAINKFDYKKGFHFSTYATSWIEREIYTFYGETTATFKTPRYVVNNGYKINRAKRKYEEENKGQTPSNKQLAEITDLTESIVDDVMFCSAPIISLSTPVKNITDNDIELESTIPSKENVEELIIDSVFQEKIRDLLKENFLSDKERDVIYRRFGFINSGETETLDAVGKDYNVSRERIRQIEEKALRKIKLRMEKKGMDKYCLV